MDIDKLFGYFPSEEDLMNIIMNTSKTVWERELVEKDIENWLTNFKGEVYDAKYEKLLALWLLSHFTYYNQTEVVHLCKIIYRDLIHKVVGKSDLTKVTIDKSVDDFFYSANIISPEKTSGSGGFIAYFFRHENHLPMTLFNFSLENINPAIENIIVIDDVTLTEGSAGQMYKFWQQATTKFKGKKFYLLTLIASESSYNYLTSTFGIEIVSAIKLDNRDKCFSSESDTFSSFRELPEHTDIIKLAESVAVHYGKKINIPNVKPLGYEDGQYTFGFFYNTPDNALPIFWGQINGWIPILRRYHKNYKDQKYLHEERFV